MGAQIILTGVAAYFLKVDIPIALAGLLFTKPITAALVDPLEAICTEAERFGADLICLGSQMPPGLMAKVLGSVSLAVLQGSRRPAPVVWPPAE